MRTRLHVVAALGVAALFEAAAVAGAPRALADQVAYLVNVTVRPGYNFANAQTALDYGLGVCGKIASGVGYAQLINEIKSDFDTSDYYHAAYLVNQAANELCPALIWQLRNSAAGYRLEQSP